ncbi:hypothetical protein KP509_27G009300 [Ceratopteris richardii]|uniref:Protein TIC 20 n=1 Tax=Ceratopteris richardii TaxID=49495 RepID=A0A8T2RDS6_CERRI|nr:hypothetical protein KP509_27G009300 [Ceratopteris richardii]
MAHIAHCQGIAKTSLTSSSILPQIPSLPSSFLRRPRPLSYSFHYGVKDKSKRILSLTVYARGEDNDADIADRIISASAYLLPLFDGFQYGRYFLAQFPQAQVAMKPLYPILRIYTSTPFASIAVFFSFYFLVVRNPNFNRYVRFNTMQAVMLDVLLILPGLTEGIYHPQGGVGLEVLIVFYNTVFLFLVACFLVGSGSCLLGKTPRLPLVADAADAQVM